LTEGTGAQASASGTVGGLLLAVVGGVALASQSRVNGELGGRLGDGVAAALVSFGSGFVVLAVAAAVLPAGRRGLRTVWAALRRQKLRWWHLAGGASGGYFVITQGVAVASIGLAVFTVATVAGQVGSGLLVDRAGLGPGGPRPVTGARVVAAALAVVAVVVAVADRFGSPATLGLAALPAVAGIAVAWQQAMNGRVQAEAGAHAATLINFTVGTATLVLVYAVMVPLRGLPSRWPSEWWVYSGGLLGIVFVLATVAVVRVIGVLMLGLGLIAGQILASLALDVFAPAAADHLAPNTVAGAFLTLLAVVIAAVGGRGVSRRRRSGRGTGGLPGRVPPRRC
jgi:transporter family-2 protein